MLIILVIKNCGNFYSSKFDLIINYSSLILLTSRHNYPQLDIYILFLGLDSGPVAPKTLHRVPGGYLRKIRYFYASINLQLKVQCSLSSLQGGKNL